LLSGFSASLLIHSYPGISFSAHYLRLQLSPSAYHPFLYNCTQFILVVLLRSTPFLWLCCKPSALPALLPLCSPSVSASVLLR
jgi:hypothetical protein